jgi:Tol biopolymer transport system component/chitodextrinase
MKEAAETHRRPRGRCRTGFLCASCVIFVWAGCVLSNSSISWAGGRAGIDCDCNYTGEYSAPGGLRKPGLGEPSSAEEGSSPKGKYTYKVDSSPSGTGVQLFIEVREGQTLRLDFGPATVTQAGWGFSPDEDRFVIHSIGTDGTYHIWLYDLQAGINSEVLHSIFTDFGDSVLGFSPNGRYFSHVIRSSSDQVTLKVMDVLDPGDEYAAQFSLVPVSSENAGLAGWGFSPKNNGGFLFAWNTGATAASYRVINLQEMTEAVSGTAAGGTWWGFSPCGDVFALIDGSDKKVYGYGTLDGAFLGGGAYCGAAMDLKPRCDENGYHCIGDCTGEQQLFPNTAANPCSTEPDGDGGDENGDGSDENGDGGGTGGDGGEPDNEAPTWPSGSTLQGAEQHEAGLNLIWSAAEDNVGVTSYLIYMKRSGESGYTLIDEVTGDLLTCSVTGLQVFTYYWFKVEAGDAAGNVSSDGPSTFTMTSDETPPAWPPDATLTISDADKSSMTLSWTAAADNDQVAGYRLYLLDYEGDPDPRKVAEFPGSVTSFTVSCLEAGTGYRFKVEAGDVAGNWSEDGPSAVGVTSMGPECGIRTERVSVSSDGEEMRVPEGPGGIKNLAVSADGGFVAFSSNAVVDMADFQWTRVYLRDLEYGHTSIISISSDGEEANHESGGMAGGGGGRLGISSDGRFLAFASRADNLVARDTNDAWDVFVRDRHLNSTERVSVSSAGSESAGCWLYGSHSPDISAGGRYVAFASDCTNLVPEDANGDVRDVFVHDRQTHETRLVSVSSEGEQADGLSDRPSISGDGRFICFSSFAANLVPGDTNGREDVFVHDRDPDENGVFDEPGKISTTRVSVSGAGAQAEGGGSYTGAISADGRYVAFASAAGNLIPDDTNGAVDVFLHDRFSGRTELVSVSSGGAQANGHSCNAAGFIGLGISADGRFVVFDSSASNLVPGDNNNARDVFLRDRIARTTRRVSICPCGDEGDSDSYGYGLSGDGSTAAFISRAGNLLVGLADGNQASDVFVHQWQSAERITDTDQDGIEDQEEDMAPNGGDANRDGIPDREQPNVVSLREHELGRYVTFVGPEGTSFAGVRAMGESALQEPPPVGLSHPFGFFEFQVFGLIPEGTVEIHVHLPAKGETDSWYKYGSTLRGQDPHWHPFPFDGATGAVVGEETITLRYEDGGRGDHDLEANGVIMDLAAPTYAGLPVILSDPENIAVVGLLYTYNVNATDPEGGSLTFSLDVFPTGMSIDEDSGLIEWLPAHEHLGDNAVIIRVTNSEGLFTSQAFVLRVVEELLKRATPATQIQTTQIPND